MLITHVKARYRGEIDEHRQQRINEAIERHGPKIRDEDGKHIVNMHNVSWSGEDDVEILEIAAYGPESADRLAAALRDCGMTVRVVPTKTPVPGETIARMSTADLIDLFESHQRWCVSSEWMLWTGPRTPASRVRQASPCKLQYRSSSRR